MTVLPTRSCFDDAMEALEEMAQAGNPVLFQVRLVHAICLLPDDGRPFAHAWLELNERVVWAGIVDGEKRYFTEDKGDHHSRLRVQCCTKYSARRAWVENKRSGMFGPWEPRYQELCVRKEKSNVQ